jgi:hypothetical protein
VPFERYAYTLDAVGDKKRVDLLDGLRLDFDYDELRRLISEVQLSPATVAMHDIA